MGSNHCHNNKFLVLGAHCTIHRSSALSRQVLLGLIASCAQCISNVQDHCILAAQKAKNMPNDKNLKWKCDSFSLNKLLFLCFVKQPFDPRLKSSAKSRLCVQLITTKHENVFSSEFSSLTTFSQMFWVVVVFTKYIAIQFPECIYICFIDSFTVNYCLKLQPVK